MPRMIQLHLPEPGPRQSDALQLILRNKSRCRVRHTARSRASANGDRASDLRHAQRPAAKSFDLQVCFIVAFPSSECVEGGVIGTGMSRVAAKLYPRRLPAAQVRVRRDRGRKLADPKPGPFHPMDRQVPHPLHYTAELFRAK